MTVEVAAEVGASLRFQSEKIDPPEAILAALEAIPDPPLLPDPDPGRLRLDIRRINALQLEQLGITSKQIAIAPYCTYQQPEYFFSYRRTQQKNIQWSGIVAEINGSAENLPHSLTPSSLKIKE